MPSRLWSQQAVVPSRLWCPAVSGPSRLWCPVGCGPSRLWYPAQTTLFAVLQLLCRFTEYFIITINWIIFKLFGLCLQNIILVGISASFIFRRIMIAIYTLYTLIYTLYTLIYTLYISHYKYAYCSSFITKLSVR